MFARLSLTTQRALSTSLLRNGGNTPMVAKSYRGVYIFPIILQKMEFWMPRMFVTYFVWHWYHNGHHYANHNRGYHHVAFMRNSDLGLPEYNELVEIAARIRAGEDDYEMFPKLQTHDN